MKKIKTIILAAAALLAFAPAVSAQSTSTIANVINTANGYAGTPDFSRSATNTYTVKKNVAFSKQISEPLSDGTYWIKLEAFATGSATEEVSSTPSDVLLILDVSTSMTNNMYPVGSTTTRLNALKDAVKAFIASIYDNAVSASAAAQSAGITYDGNRIGIISFGGFARDDTEGWLDVQNNRGALDGIVDELATGDKGTWTSSGLRVAIENYLDGDPYAARTNANLTVVIFTDGEPATAGSGDIEIDGERTATTQNAFSSYIANNAVYYSHIMKSQYNASVFTVTLLGNSPDSRVKPFAELMSSNYPDAVALKQETKNQQGIVIPDDWTYSNGTVSAIGLHYGNTANTGYYQNVGDSDLSSIFENIARQSGGATEKTLSSATSTVDVVSHSFKLPFAANNNNTDKIKVFTAKCLTANYTKDAATGEFTFEDEYLVNQNPNTYDIYNENGVKIGEKDVDNEIEVYRAREVDTKRFFR